MPGLITEEDRKRWGLAKGDPGPVPLSSPRFKPNQARDLEQKRDSGSKAPIAADGTAATVDRARAGQAVANGTGVAIGAVNSTAKEALSKGKLLGKVAGEVLDGPITGLSAGLKYKELKALGYSDRAALAGAAAAGATSQAFTRGGAALGGLGGAAVAGVGAIPGTVIGGAFGSGLDWWTDVSGSAAKRAADMVDGRKK